MCLRLAVPGAWLSSFIQAHLETIEIHFGGQKADVCTCGRIMPQVQRGTYCDGSASFSGRDHVSSQSLWRVEALQHLLLDEMHGQGKLLPAQLTHLPGVRQSPARDQPHEHRVEQSRTAGRKTSLAD